MDEPEIDRPRSDMLSQLFGENLDPAYQQAADARAARGPQPRSTRLVGRAAALVVLVVAGLLFAVAYRQVIAREPERERVRDGLVEEIRQRQEDNQALASEAELWQDEVARVREQTINDASLARRLTQLEAATGLRRVTGDGVVVTVDDGPATVNADDLSAVQDADLQQICNALWSAGAEAVSINDQRITTVTSIRRAGAGIRVNNVHISGPYVISAIGPEGLRDAYDRTAYAAVMRQLRDDPELALQYRVEERDGLVLPAAVVSQLHFAVPSPSPSGGGK